MPIIRNAQFPPRRGKSLILILLRIAFCILLCSKIAVSARAETAYTARGIWSSVKLPAGAVNLALKSAGAWATASSTAPGFEPDAVLDGDWTVRNWGKGHGWQSATKHEFPCWLEVRLPRAQEIDTIIVETFPPVMRGLNWLGVRNVDIDVEWKGAWHKLGNPTTVRANTRQFIVMRIPAFQTSAIRINVLGVNNPGQEDVFWDDDDYARILQVGIFRLQIPYPFAEEDSSVDIERGRLGRIGVYRDKLLPAPKGSSSPDYLASVFREAGYGVTFLDSKALSVPEIFNRKNFDIFVQPYGPLFPVDTLLFEFLKAGGHLITLGGHPFRRALMFSPVDGLVEAGYDPGITTVVSRRFDYSLPFREQLGMFYAGYQRLDDVALLGTAPDQQVFRTALKINGEFRGEAASALVGERLSLDESKKLTEQSTFPAYGQRSREGLSHVASVLNGVPGGASFDYLTGYIFNWPRSRWIPLVNGYDRLGHLRGAAISLLSNYGGPYRGSSWIFSGVSNEDLFSPKYPQFTKLLLESMEYLRHSVVLHGVEAELDCYYQGETVKAGAVVENFRSESRHVNVKFQFIPEDGSAPAFEKTQEIELAAAESRRIGAEWNPPRFDSDLYRIRVIVSEDHGEIDSAQSGFVVWSPATLARGPKVEFRDSYFQVDGHPELLIGTRTNGLHLHGQADEDALAWNRQFAQMRDNGMKVVSPVFFSAYVPGLAWGTGQHPAIPLQLQRVMDAQVLLAQRNHLIFAPCLFFVAKFLAMERPEFSRRICEEIGKHYASVPGIMFYIFDDGTPPIPLTQFNSWTRECLAGFAASGRKYVVMGETGGTALERYGSSALSFPSNGTYSNGYPAPFRMMDMRAVGKSFHLSEFGVNSPGATPRDVDLHQYPGTQISGSSVGDYSVYLMEPHLLFATGGAYLVNWDWKDPAHLIFPWGLVNPNDYTPKDPLTAYRNSSYFLRHFRPAFHIPDVLVVFSKERLLRDEDTFGPYLRATLDNLIESDVQFAVIDDVDLDRIPPGPHVLIYPDPRYAVPAVMNKLLSRVRAGDTLFITGDFSWPAEPGGSREADLFNRLAGLTWVADYSANTDIAITPVPGLTSLTPWIGHPISIFRPAGASVLAADPNGNTVVSSKQVGSGSVFFCSDSGIQGTRRALTAFLKLHSISATAMSPIVPNRPIFEIERADGGRVFTLFAVHPTADNKGSTNGPWIEAPEKYSVTVGSRRVEVPLGTYGVSAFAVRSDQTIDAVEGQGRFTENGSLLLNSEPHVMVMSLDGRPLHDADAIGVLPIGPGKIELALTKKDYVIEAGEISGHAFHSVETVAARYEGDALKFQIDAVQSREIFLISTVHNLSRAHELINAAF